jgi:uncharacterized damage-inducible protein DinB
MNEKSNALADRLEQGSRALAEFASALTDEEWQTPIPHDGRTIGVVVHHVASVYPIEIELAQTIAGGKPVVGVTSEVINSMNASHAEQNRDVTRDEALALLRRNSEAAAAAIRSLTEEDLNRAAPVSLYSDAPLTCQFVLEDHAVRHSYHHFALIRAALTEVFMQF